MKNSTHYCLAFACISFCHAEPSAIEQLRCHQNALLAHEETALKNEIFAVLDVLPAEYERTKNVLRESYYRTWHAHDAEQAKSACPFSPRIQTIVDRIVLLHDPEKHILFLRDEEQPNSIATRAHTIFISEAYLEKYCLNDLEIEATILHEIMHIRNEDALEREIFNTLISIHPCKSENEQAALQKKIFHFHEKRADIQTCLLGARYAQARHENFKRLAFSDIPSGDTHPLHTVRAEYMKHIAYLSQALHIAETYLKK